MLDRINRNLRLYVHGKKWYYYLPFFFLTVYFLFEVMHFQLGSDSTPLIVAPFQMLDFGIHELGHIIFGFMPPVIVAAMGVGSEVLFPLTVAGTAFWYKQYFTGAMCLSWVGLAMRSGGQYMADARSQSIPLVSISGDGAIHDWNFVFGKLGLLQQDHVIGGGFMLIGLFLAIGGLAFGAFLLIKMAASADVTITPEEAGIPVTVPVGKIEVPKPGEEKPLSQLYPTAQQGPMADDTRHKKPPSA